VWKKRVIKGGERRRRDERKEGSEREREREIQKKDVERVRGKKGTSDT